MALSLALAGGLLTWFLVSLAVAPADDPSSPDAESPAWPEDQDPGKQGAGSAAGDDLAWNVVGTSDGLHVLAAQRSENYQWRTVATLGSMGTEADLFIGNACLAVGTTSLVVVYGPRYIADQEETFDRGAFGAVVDLQTGESTALEGTYSIAHSSPSCGDSGRVTLAQASEAEDRTRLVTFHADAPDAISVVETDSRFSSVVPTDRGLVAAVGSSLVAVTDDGTTQVLLETQHPIFQLATGRSGSLVFLQELDGTGSRAMQLRSGESGVRPDELASGALQDLGLLTTGSGLIVLSGSPGQVTPSLPDDVIVAVGSAVHGMPSSEGELISNQGYVPPTVERGSVVVVFEAHEVATGATLEFSVPNADAPGASAPGGGW